MSEEKPTVFGGRDYHTIRDNLEAMAEQALTQNDTRTIGALLAIAAGLYANASAALLISSSVDELAVRDKPP